MRFRNLLLTLATAGLWTLGGAGPVTAEEVKLSADGRTLNARLELPEGKTVADGVVLITHGTLAHNGMELVRTLQQLLTERGLGTLAITLSLGLDDRQGMYDCAVPHRHRHADGAAEIGRWVDWLEQQGAKPIVVLGHSRGGNQVAWYAAEQQPTVVAGLVLVAPMTTGPADLAEDYLESTGEELAPVVERASALVDKGEAEAELKPIDILYCKDTTATAESFLSYHAYDLRFDTPGLLGRIQVPVLVAVAGEDEVLPGLQEAFGPSATAGKAEVVVIDGAGHFFRDLYAEDLADAIATFVEGL